MQCLSRQKQHYSATILLVIPEKHTLSIENSVLIPDLMPGAKIPSLAGLVPSRLVEVLMVPPHDAIMPEISNVVDGRFHSLAGSSLGVICVSLRPDSE